MPDTDPSNGFDQQSLLDYATNLPPTGHNPLTTARPIALTREGTLFRLAFSYRQDLVDAARGLPYAHFDGSSSWTCFVCTQSADLLRQMYYQGLVDVPPDSLLVQDEVLPTAPPATLRSTSSEKRPFIVTLAMRGDPLYAKLRSIPGSMWEKKAAGVSYPPSAAAALIDFVERGLIADPEQLLLKAATTVVFDARTGTFIIKGDDRAKAAFAKYYPQRDVITAWKEKGLDVAFDSTFSEEIYRGELARAGEGLQPEGFKIDLYPYQAQSVAIATQRSGLGIFQSPGLGKTAIAIATAYELIENQKQSHRALIVVPGAVRTQWASEIRRFTGHDDVVVVIGTAKARQEAYEKARDARWVVVGYDIVGRDFKDISTLASGAVLIADEAHRLKNPKAKRTQAMRKLATRAARRLALSGTPVENEPGEWFSVLSGFTIPGLFGSPQDFLGRYQYPGRFGGYEGARNLQELRVRSKPHYIRHTKAQVASHLPPLRVYPVLLDPDPAYAAALRRAHQEARDEIKEAALARSQARKARGGVGEDEDEVETAAEMTAVGMLKLLCISPRLIANSDSPSARALREAGIVPDEDGPKLDHLRQMLGEFNAANERVVVFSSSRKMADLIAERLDEDNISYAKYTGTTSHQDRDAAVAAFTTPPTETNPGPLVLIATDAGSEGLNLGKCCSTIINVDIPWKSTTLEQRGNRIHRIDGTAESYQVINLVLTGTLELGLLRLVERKADLQDAILGEAGGRKRTTGRGGKNLFEEALTTWETEK